MLTITEKLENKFGMDVTGSRKMSLDFYQRIIEDITNLAVLQISYDERYEFLKAVFAGIEEDLLINIHMDSLTAVTNDVIRQTTEFINALEVEN